MIMPVFVMMGIMPIGKFSDGPAENFPRVGRAVGPMA
jgi:hypothetical protein